MPPTDENTQTFLITGATGFLGRRLVVRLLAESASARIIGMGRANDPQQAEAEKFISAQTGSATDRIRWMACDIAKPNLGLDDDDLTELAGTGELNVIHLAALYDLEAEETLSKALTLDGAINAYQTALAIRRHPERGDRPVRFCQTSTLAVAGTYDGEFGETGEELGLVAGKHTDWYSQHKYEAELALRKVACQTEVPLMIARPGIAVGDSDTGAIEKIDGPYCLLEYMRWPVVRHFLPGAGDEPFWMVPGDFVVNAMATLTANPDAYGHTFNLLYPPEETPIWSEFLGFTQHVLRNDAPDGGSSPGLMAKIRYGWHLPLSTPLLIALGNVPIIGRLSEALLSAMGVEPHSLHYTVRNPRYIVANYRKFGVEPPPPWRDVWRMCIRYYRNHRDEMKAGSRVAHQRDV